MWLLKAFANLFEIFTVAGAGIGVFVLTTGMATAQSAVQEGAAAAVALACVAIPYCVASVFHRAASRLQSARTFDATFETLN